MVRTGLRRWWCRRHDVAFRWVALTPRGRAGRGGLSTPKSPGGRKPLSRERSEWGCESGWSARAQRSGERATPPGRGLTGRGPRPATIRRRAPPVVTTRAKLGPPGPTRAEGVRSLANDTTRGDGVGTGGSGPRTGGMVRLARLSVSTLAGRTDIAHLSGHVGTKRGRLSHLPRSDCVQLMSMSSAFISPVTTFSTSDRAYPNASVRNVR